jgi:formate/nitrite transporter FocA (FNT family)
MAEAGSNSPHLVEEEQQQAADHAPLPARVVHEIVRDEGEEELKRSAGQLLWSGLAAGLSMGFSFMIQAELKAALPAAPWTHVLASFGYCLGFLAVVLGRQQLFTESTLTAVLPVLTRRDVATGLACLKVWALVLLANVAGTWIFAAALAYGHPFRPEVLPALSGLARDAVAEGAGAVFLKAIFAGWLIALMVWLLPSARSARILVIVALTYAVALARLSHIIAGSTEAAFAVLSGGAPFSDYAVGFFLPTLFGNTIGGVLLVALLNHAPVAPELGKS